MMAEVYYFAEEMELYSPEGNLVAPLADYRLQIDIPYDADWTVGDIEYPNGENVQRGKFGYALYEIIKDSIRRPENKRHVRNIEEMVADARWQERNRARSAADEYRWRVNYEGVR